MRRNAYNRERRPCIFMMTTMTQPKAELGITSPEVDAFYPNMKRAQFEIGGKPVYVETGRIARSSHGSVVLQCGETVVMANVTGSENVRPGIDFFPLLVDYEEKLYSVGRIPGGYKKREARPTDQAILISRLIDRPIRPLFPDGYRNDVQIVTTGLASDHENPMDTLAIVAASFALTLANNIPFQGPLGAVRVGRVNGSFIANPTYKQREESDLDLVVAGTRDSIMMVEAGADFVTETDLVDALAFAHEEIKAQVDAQEAFAHLCGVEVNHAFTPEFDNTPLKQFLAERYESRINEAYHDFDADSRKEKVKVIKDEAKQALADFGEDHALNVLIASQETGAFGETFKSLEKSVMRTMIMKEGVRADGRKADEIRPIKCHVGVLPRVHGSALFTRGGTQVLSIATLGSPGDAQRLDGVEPETQRKWLHHYNFPSYSVGEVRPNRGAGRREIGHGCLAERAVEFSLPGEKEFPYTMRVVSEVVSSNGSTSMGSTCAATLALMDAGVPLKKIVGGIAMGLIKEGNESVILSDIQGLEDFLGDMDFKVTGNTEGITALQMDIKIQGISIDIMAQALEQARLGRLHILGKMAEAIETPRMELSTYAPRIETIQIDVDQIGTVIGPGGKTIRSIIEETGATIDINDEGIVHIATNDGEAMKAARKRIEDLTRKFEPDMMIKGIVQSIIPIGAFVQLAPGKDGMVHISQLPCRVGIIEDALNVGDEVLVRVIAMDERGRINLTMRDITDEQRAEFGLPPFVEPETLSPRPEREERPRGGDRGGRGGGGGFRGDRGPRGGGGGGRDRY
jgi:polyribonucleotide nucleotidyltransferase